MYLPAAFREDRIEIQHDLIRTHPLGWIVTAGPGGLIANSVPFVLDAAAGEHGTLRAHIARANPLAAELALVDECLVIFQGPQAYITPSWYETKRETGKVVPTWNYATVHAWGKPRVVDDEAWLRRQLADLTGKMEAPRAQPWAVDDAPADFIAAMVRGVIGVEIPIARSEGKWKVSQNRPAADIEGVISGLREGGATGEPMAALVAARAPAKAGA